MKVATYGHATAKGLKYLLCPAGVTGVGKSVISTAALDSMVERKGLVPHSVVFSAQTSALDTQMLMESKLEKKRKTRSAGRIVAKLTVAIARWSARRACTIGRCCVLLVILSPIVC